jgi:hypothetical protein
MKNERWDGKSFSLEQNGSMDNPNIVKLTTSNDEDGSTRVLFGGGARVRISGFYTM